MKCWFLPKYPWNYSQNLKMKAHFEIRDFCLIFPKLSLKTQNHNPLFNLYRFLVEVWNMNRSKIYCSINITDREKIHARMKQLLDVEIHMNTYFSIETSYLIVPPSLKGANMEVEGFKATFLQTKSLGNVPAIQYYLRKSICMYCISSESF